LQLYVLLYQKAAQDPEQVHLEAKEFQEFQILHVPNRLHGGKPEHLSHTGLILQKPANSLRPFDQLLLETKRQPDIQ
jgi:hypothetical protein